VRSSKRKEVVLKADVEDLDDRQNSKVSTSQSRAVRPVLVVVAARAEDPAA
jgi:hypothetical protein